MHTITNIIAVYFIIIILGLVQAPRRSNDIQKFNHVRVKRGWSSKWRRFRCKNNWKRNCDDTDRTPPTVNCPSIASTIMASQGQKTVTVKWPQATASDKSGVQK